MQLNRKALNNDPSSCLLLLLLLLPQKSSSDEQPVRLIHLQDIDRCSSYSGYPHDARSVHREVFLPDIPSRIEQADRLTGFGVEAGNIGPFVTVAVRACRTVLNE
jgi:hypothetical protein